MATLDLCAWFCTVWDFLAALCGRRPPTCVELCRVVVARTRTRRILCAQQCSWPAEHGSAFHHCCRVHKQQGGSLSREMMDSWEVFSWGHRVHKKARCLLTTTYRLLSKWRVARVAILGSMVVLWFTVLAGSPKTQGEPGHPYPLLAPPTLPQGENDLSETWGMFNGRKVELNQGYHKRAYVYLGKLSVLTTFDTGTRGILTGVGGKTEVWAAWRPGGCTKGILRKSR